MNAASHAETAGLREYLEACRSRVDEALDHYLPPASQHPESIHRALRYAVFAGGKRLRPILALEAAKMLQGEDQVVMPFAAALELIHTYSLIHDDLPALDNDDLRRGKPTLHRAFNEPTAILSGDALLSLAFEVICTGDRPTAAVKLRLIRELAQAIGTRGGMVGGQVVDLETTCGSHVDTATLDYIHGAKTGALIRMAVRGGALCATSAEAEVERLSFYGEKIGLAFQIADDLLDESGTPESLGKTPGKDRQQNKATYPYLHGRDQSVRTAARLVDEACSLLAPYGPAANRLQQIAHFLIERNA